MLFIVFKYRKMKRVSLLPILLIILSIAAYPQETFRLYDAKPPGSESWNYKEVEFSNPGTKTKMLRNVVDPTLAVYFPEKSIATGTAVIICPGGGNVWLSYESEGTAVAQWLAKKGITALVLKYRLRKTPEDPKDFDEFWKNFGKPAPSGSAPVTDTRNYGGEDGLKAVSYVREHTGQFGIDPRKVGIMGFSAGAGVTTYVILNSDSANQPNFAGVIYGGWLRGAKVPEAAPPLFILCAADDRIAANSPELFKAWREAGKPAELHIYSKGGHGFGMDHLGLPVDNWIERFYEWIKVTGF